jgi:hypothetical protein
MSVSILNAPVPQAAVPFLNKDGTVSRPWLYFLISMNARTGGSTPILPADLQSQINSLFVEEAFDDPQPAAVRVTFSADTIFAEEPVRMLNPILASLLVSDAA